MNILQINSCNYGSTGSIMLGIAKKAAQCGYTVYVSYPDSRQNRKKQVDNSILISNRIFRNIHYKVAYLTGFNGCFSVFSTLNFLNKVKKLNIDIIHLHNLHNCYINLPLLFRYIKKNDIKTVWTLHDCWSFTGHCPYFEMAGCNKWKKACGKCPIYKDYPKSLIDNTKLMYRLKKRWFKGVEELTVVTPSKWLGDLVKQSFLKEYPVKVINNGIDLSVFKPTQSDFRKRFACEDKFLLLGVAFGWGKRKGLDVIIELSKRLDDRFKIVLVGTDNQVDNLLPDNIISVHRTHNQRELAEIYSAADLFVNPTREENYPTVNMEAIACGTPVLTFNTGGSPEIPDELSGSAVDCDDIDKLYNEIIRIYKGRLFNKKDCLKRAESFDRDIKFSEYIDLYGLGEDNAKK